MIALGKLMTSVTWHCCHPNSVLLHTVHIMTLPTHSQFSDSLTFRMQLKNCWRHFISWSLLNWAGLFVLDQGKFWQRIGQFLEKDARRLLGSKWHTYFCLVSSVTSPVLLLRPSCGSTENALSYFRNCEEKILYTIIWFNSLPLLTQ